MSTHETLGLLLVRDGVITRPQLYDALRLQRQNNRLLGTCLLSLGYVTPEALLQSLSRQLAIPALPAGTLDRAAPAAIQRVPPELALRLRVLPYSWDGHVLGVAVADGRVLGNLHEVAYHSRSAVGAYVALEVEIDAMLRRFYADLVPQPPSAAPPAREQAADPRPRPARAAPLVEVPTRDFAAALGLAEAVDPVELGVPTGRQQARPVMNGPPRRAPIAGPPPAAPPTRGTARASAEALLTRLPFYDAVERVYSAKSSQAIGREVGCALLNYFTRVLVLALEGSVLEVVGFAGLPAAPPSKLALETLPHLAAGLAARRIVYGPAAGDPRSGELVGGFELGPAPTSLLATVATAANVRLVVHADNGPTPDLYEDLHDVELLFKEAETALSLLSDG